MLRQETKQSFVAIFRALHVHEVTHAGNQFRLYFGNQTRSQLESRTGLIDQLELTHQQERRRFELPQL